MRDSVHQQGRTSLAVCDCGKLHFRYGMITVHFEPEEFAAFARDVCGLAAMFSRHLNRNGVSRVLDHDRTTCH